MMRGAHDWLSAERTTIVDGTERRLYGRAVHALPRHVPDLPSARSESDEDVVDAAHHPVLLVVDDDTGLREALAEVLRDERYVVATAADGNEALSLMRAGLRPAAVLLDLWMPNLDGVTALRLMRSDPRLNDIPVIVITAGSAPDDVSVKTDAQSIMKKPLDLGRLVVEIERHRRRH